MPAVPSKVNMIQVQVGMLASAKSLPGGFAPTGGLLRYLQFQRPAAAAAGIHLGTATST